MIYSEFKNTLLSLLDNKLNALFGGRVAIAVSGGSDSMALLMLMKQYCGEINCDFIAITIDHNLRSESAEEAKEVGKILEKFHIEHKIIKWEGEKPKSNIQETARIARYELLTKYCKDHNINYLFTAHQMNDQAENFLIRAERGSGIYGLAGINNKIILNGITVLRPLLKVLKSDLQAYLNQLQIKWVDDPSNYNECFTRVKHRKFLEDNQKLIKIFASISEKLAPVKEAIDVIVEQNLAKLVNFAENKQASFNLLEFNSLPQEIRFRMLERILQNISEAQKPARGERIARLLDKLMKGKGFVAATLSNCLIFRKKDIIFVKEENKV